MNAPKFTFELLTESGDLIEVSLPAKFEVCSRCRGAGTHVNPSIDGNGITAAEMAELGDDFREDYLSGTYDVQCEECKGERVVSVVDTTRLTKLQRAQLKQHRKAEDEAFRDWRSESWLRRAESGERW